MRTRVQRLIDQLSSCGISQKQEMKIPTHIPTVSLVRVLRDGVWYNHPTGLLVEGDVIQLSLGDTAPCKLQLLSVVSHKLDQWTPEPFILHKNTMLTPKVLQMPDDDCHFSFCPEPQRSLYSAMLQDPMALEV